MITFRPASTADLSMVLSCRVREPVSWVDPGRYQRELAVGSYRARMDLAGPIRRRPRRTRGVVGPARQDVTDGAGLPVDVADRG